MLFRSIEWLRHIATTCIKPNPVLGLLRRIPQRSQTIQMTALSKAERQQRRTLDKVFQRDVVRKIRKWERAVQAGRMNSHTNNNAPVNTRAGNNGKQADPRQQRQHQKGRAAHQHRSNHRPASTGHDEHMCFDKEGQPYKCSGPGMHESRIQEQSPSKTSINTLDDAAALQMKKKSTHHGTGVSEGVRHGTDDNRMHTIDSHVHRQHLQHRPNVQHDANGLGQTRQPHTPNEQLQHTVPSPSSRTDGPPSQIADSNNPIDSADWKQWRQLTPLQRQQFREQRMMQHLKGHTPVMPQQPSSMDMGRMLQQLTGTAEAAPTCAILTSGGSERNPRAVAKCVDTVRLQSLAISANASLVCAYAKQVGHASGVARNIG